MSLLSYVEIAEADSQPVVTLGKVNARELATGHHHEGVRLRLYVQDDRVPGKSTFAVLHAIHERLTGLADPGSAVRSSLIRYLGPADERLFFTIVLPDFTEVRPVSSSTSWWLDFEREGGGTRLLLLEADGPQANIEKLLDGVSYDLGEREAKVASAPVATVDASQQAAIDFRDQLLDLDWPDGKRVALMAGTQSATNPNQYAARLRSLRRLLGVWAAQRKTFVHPTFQFDRLGQLRPEVGELLDILPDKDDRGGWERAFWLYSPHGLLEGKTPADVFTDDPQRVIAVAKREFAGDQDANW
jgi:hypothetical protein